MANIENLNPTKQNTEKKRYLQEQFWRDFIEKQKESGMTQADFSRQHSIPPHQFTYWKRAIMIRDGKIKPNRKKKNTKSLKNKIKPSLIPVKVVSENKPAESITQNSFEIVLSNNMMLRVPQQFDGKSLLQLLSILEKKC